MKGEPTSGEETSSQASVHSSRTKMEAIKKIPEMRESEKSHAAVFFLKAQV